MAVSYRRIPQRLGELRGCLAEGHPFVFGFTVYENFFRGPGKQQTVVPMPAGQVLGGHAVMAVGYDDRRQAFLARNSWGVHQGDHGYFHMPYAYLTDPGLAADFWTVRTISA
ncbi:MAG: C1 family peptidase [Thermoleophilia bacterium]